MKTQTFKRSLSLMMAVAMVFGVGSSAFATDGTTKDTEEQRTSPYTQTEQNTTTSGAAILLLVDGTVANDDAPRAEGVAYKTLGGAVDKAQDGDTIKMMTDETLSGAVIMHKNLTLDLGGRTIGNNSVYSNAIAINSGNTLTLQDSIGTGVIRVKNGAQSSNKAIDNRGTLHMTGGTIETEGPINALYNEGTVNISGGTIRAAGTIGTVLNKGTITVSGNAGIEATAENGIAIQNHVGSTLYVTGGTVSALGIGGKAIENYNHVTVSGGSITAPAMNGMAIENRALLHITGGTISATGLNGLSVNNINGNTITLTGGNVGAMNLNGGTVMGTNGEALTLYAFTIGEQPNKAVTSMTLTEAHPYELAGVTTNGYGVLNVWLPANKSFTAVSVVIDNVQYNGYINNGIASLTTAPLAPPPAYDNGGYEAVDNDYTDFIFWSDIIDEIKATSGGDTLTVQAKSYDKVPVRVMEALADKGNITLVIKWDGDDIIIPASAAPQTSGGRVYYMFTDLLDWYEDGVISDGEIIETPGQGNLKPNPGTGRL